MSDKQTESITIRVKPNEDNPEVGVKYVGSFEYATPKVGRDGKVITGIDENCFDINNLPDDQKKVEQKKVKALRESLEKVLGVNSLAPDSNYWDEFVIVLEDGITIDPATNPKERLFELFLIANGYVAPDEDAFHDDERFHNAMFYFHRKEVVVSKKAKLQKAKDKATSLLIALDENPTKLKMVTAYLLGVDANIDMDAEECYIKLKEYIETGEHADAHRDEFIAAIDKSHEELMTKQIFDRAIKKKIVTSRGDKFMRGEEIYGHSYDDALEFLLLPENSGELALLKKKVESLKK